MNHFSESRSFIFGLSPEAETFADRIEAACRVLEREFPALPIDFTMPYHRSDAGGPHKVENRHKYLRQRTRTKLWWFVLNDGEGWPEAVTIMGRMNDEDIGTLGVETMFPAAPWDFCERLLVELGDVLGANYSAVLPPEALGLCATQFNTYWAPHDSTLIQRGLPRLDDFTYGGADDIAQPMYLGWLNYWSEATCAFVGFSGNKEDLALAPFSYRTPGGAWLVKLTEEPMDVSCPEHVDALVAAYRRWPRVGKKIVC